ncbi:MAG TPA: hypothetical protein VJ952_06095, partial [Opitutales bacterium]|nr:hypothetical protein [Opitutales bacterium]
LIPEFVGKNRKNLRELAALEVQSWQCGGPRDSIEGLVALYDRAGQDQYNWTTFKNLRQSEWQYHSFDPIPAEQVPFDQLITRYREVTLPRGMENWFDPSFEPEKAGWQVGQAPFGNYNGAIPEGRVSKCLRFAAGECIGPMCFGDTPVNTLWDKEVLLIRKTVKLPPLKDGHRYRLRVNQLAHVGNGNGFGIYINGKLMMEMEKGFGRGMGEKPYGAYITKEWLDEFGKDEVTIAVKSFLRYNDKYKNKPTERIPQGRISVHIEEQKLPPMGDDLVHKSATVVPMTTSAWNNAVHDQKEDSSSSESDLSELLFRWDGEVKLNKALLGDWKLITGVESIDAFDPEAKQGRARHPLFESVNFRGDGTTSEPTFIWTGHTLMDLNRYEALQMQFRTIQDKQYLFIEKGDFRGRHRFGGRDAYLVFAR